MVDVAGDEAFDVLLQPHQPAALLVGDVAVGVAARRIGPVRPALSAAAAGLSDRRSTAILHQGAARRESALAGSAQRQSPRRPARRYRIWQYRCHAVMAGLDPAIDAAAALPVFLPLRSGQIPQRW